MSDATETSTDLMQSETYRRRIEEIKKERADKQADAERRARRDESIRAYVVDQARRLFAIQLAEAEAAARREVTVLNLPDAPADMDEAQCRERLAHMALRMAEWWDTFDLGEKLLAVSELVEFARLHPAMYLLGRDAEGKPQRECRVAKPGRECLRLDPLARRMNAGRWASMAQCHVQVPEENPGQGW